MQSTAALHADPPRARQFCLLFVLCVAITTIGCSTNKVVPASNAASCSPFATHSCAGISGCRGVQRCQTEGTWTACDCAAALDNPLLGGLCDNDTACPAGATCLLPDSTAWQGGGPPKGLCVADCSSDVAICTAFSAAVCVSALRPGESGTKRALCLPTCDLKLGSATAFACNSVPSSACESLEIAEPGRESEGFCRPFCTFDNECPLGHCNRQAGVCVAEALPATLSGFGAGCNATSDCDGVCLKLNSAGTNVCTNRCIYGSSTSDGADLNECGTQGASPRRGVCLYAPRAASPGNLGYCTPLCDCNDDCLASGFICRAFSTDYDAAAQYHLGHVGMCIPANGSAGVACSTGG